MQFFLNPLMLIGLAGIALPVIAHLLSRRKYDIVQWGAMQFLNPSRKTRRKMRLEELLLLLIRIGAIALIALALSRPWFNSGLLMGYSSAGSRDVVLIIDGSNSMGRSDGLTSLHQKAIRRAHEFIETLQPGDTVAVIDARDVPIPVIESPLQDHELVKQEMGQIPPPAGASALRQACEDAIGILGRCSNGSREIVVLTDRQRVGWTPADDASWQRFDEMLKFPSVRPDLWVVDLSHGLSAIKQNLSVGRMEVSRDLTVPNFPLSFQVPIRNSGAISVDVPLQVLVNGQRFANMDATVTVPADSEATFSRSHRFPNEGTNLITVKVDVPQDALPADNESHAAVRVSSAIPVLLVESSNSLNKTRWHTFFAELALTAPQNKSPWIRARTVKARDLTVEDLETVSAVVLADVNQLPDGLPAALHDFAVQGNGIFISLGDETSAQAFETLYSKSGLFPGLKLNRVRSADPDAVTPTTIAPYSLEAGWLNRFRERKGASLLKAPFERWWLVELAGQSADPSSVPTASSPTNDIRNEKPDTATDAAGGKAAKPVRVAQLTSGDPLLLQVACGQGSVLLMTSDLAANWNALPTQPDYVPFLHEALFQMAASKVRRNVSFGEPLLTILPDAMDKAAQNKLSFLAPFERTAEAIFAESSGQMTARLPGTRLPGVYQLADVSEPKPEVFDAFVVNYDHAEDAPNELTDDDKARLIVGNRMTFVESIDSLKKAMYGNESRSELWGVLLWLFLALLTLEFWMTRRLVMSGHADTDLKNQSRVSVLG